MKNYLHISPDFFNNNTRIWYKYVRPLLDHSYDHLLYSTVDRTMLPFSERINGIQADIRFTLTNEI